MFHMLTNGFRLDADSCRWSGSAALGLPSGAVGWPRRHEPHRILVNPIGGDEASADWLVWGFAAPVPSCS